MKSLLLLFPFIFCPIFSHTQTEEITGCPQQSSDAILHANDVWAVFPNHGQIHFSYETTFFEGYIVDDDGILKNLPRGLWMGGFETGTNNTVLKTAASTYNNNGRDYWPGPLAPDGGYTESTICNQWNRTWSVRRHDIEAHLLDFAIDGVIDLPNSNVMGWPGRGNPHFSDLFGFELPDTDAGLAPFSDVNENGIYDPMNGDFPMLENTDRIPEQIIWLVFNDEGGGQIHNVTQGQTLRMEIQLTAWAYYCEEDEIMNETIFSSYKFINRAVTDIDSFHVGIWQDLDFGCFVYEGVGCSADLNTTFEYSLDEDVGNPNCPFPEVFENTPCYAMTFLNRNLDYMQVYFNPSFGNSNCQFAPATAAQYYSLMTGFDEISELLGCNPDHLGADLTYPDDPNNPDGWSMYVDEVDSLDARSISSANLGLLKSGEFTTLDIAYSYHRGEGFDHLENVILMYDEVVQIREKYNNEFSDECTQPTCSEILDDCVWPGDANRYEIVNFYDLLSIGLAFSETGTSRQSLNFWAPWTSGAWTDEINGINEKHTDCNGDGITDEADIEIIEDHDGFVTPYFEPTMDVYQEGPEIFINTQNSVNPDNMELGQLIAIRVNAIEVPELYGLAFQLEYDNRYFPDINAGNPSSQGISFLGEAVNDEFTTTVSVAVSRTHPDSVILDGRMLQLIGFALENYNWTLPSNQTTVRVKNIRGVKADGSEIELGATALTFTFPEIMVSGIDEEMENSIVVFPNPVSSNLQIVSENGNIEQYFLTDIYGKLIVSEKGVSEKVEIGMGGFLDGIYFLKIEIGGQFYSKKIIVSRK